MDSKKKKRNQLSYPEKIKRLKEQKTVITA